MIEKYPLWLTRCTWLNRYVFCYQVAFFDNWVWDKQLYYDGAFLATILKD